MCIDVLSMIQMSNCKHIEVLLIKTVIFILMTFNRPLIVKIHLKGTLALVSLHQKEYMSSSSTV
jgi:hypothetical protein